MIIRFEDKDLLQFLIKKDEKAECVLCNKESYYISINSYNQPLFKFMPEIRKKMNKKLGRYLGIDLCPDCFEKSKNLTSEVNRKLLNIEQQLTYFLS